MDTRVAVMSIIVENSDTVTDMNKNLALVLICTTLLLFVVAPAWADIVAQNDSLLNELRAQNELLQQRSRFTTGGLAMILVVTAMLLFLVVNNRWNHRLEIKNRQLERERNVVIAKNKQLAIEYNRAEEALKARKAFMQSITHEVRTPLNAISGFTQVLATPDLEMTAAERRAEIAKLEKEMKKAAQMLEYEYAAVLRDRIIELRGEKDK